MASIHEKTVDARACDSRDWAKKLREMVRDAVRSETVSSLDFPVKREFTGKFAKSGGIQPHSWRLNL